MLGAHKCLFIAILKDSCIQPLHLLKTLTRTGLGILESAEKVKTYSVKCLQKLTMTHLTYQKISEVAGQVLLFAFLRVLRDLRCCQTRPR
jgi:hypothetical protein